MKINKPGQINLKGCFSRIAQIIRPKARNDATSKGIKRSDKIKKILKPKKSTSFQIFGRSELRKFKKEAALEFAEELKRKNDEIKSLKSENKRIKLTMDPDFEKAEFWNNKWARNPITYPGRNNKLYDVRSFIDFPSTVLESAKRELKIYDSDSNDAKATKVIKWSIDNLKYNSDEGEYWMFAGDMWHKRQGDCEDFSHLIISLLRNFGVPAFRLKVCCGWAVNQSNQQKIGHSYAIYLREIDDEWVDLDGTFYPSREPVEKRELVKNNPAYSDTWFTFNDLFSWSQKSLQLKENKIKNEEIR